MPAPKTILLAGANRGLGLGLVREYLGRGWHVVATARDPAAASELATLAQAHGDALTVERLDVADPASVRALASRFSGRALDVLFVVAGMNGHAGKPIHEVPQADIAREFLVNSSSPVALAEALESALAPHAAVAFMTSTLGSIAGNTSGGYELYRGTKAALNMFAASYALRHAGRPVLLLHPGWVRTDMGGPSAPLDVETSVKGLAQVIEQHANRAGVAYLDYQGKTLPW